MYELCHGEIMRNVRVVPGNFCHSYSLGGLKNMQACEKCLCNQTGGERTIARLSHKEKISAANAFTEHS